MVMMMSLKERYVKAVKDAQERYPSIDDVRDDQTRYNRKHLELAKIFKDRAREDFKSLPKVSERSG